VTENDDKKNPRWIQVLSFYRTFYPFSDIGLEAQIDDGRWWPVGVVEWSWPCMLAILRSSSSIHTYGPTAGLFLLDLELAMK